MTIDIPGFGTLEIKYLVLDFNGTLARDGRLLEGSAKLINQLSNQLEIFVITADTFGTVEREMEGLPVKIVQMGKGDEREEKRALIKKLGAQQTAAVGNGKNDEYMLKEAAAGICIMGREGCSPGALLNADAVVSDLRDALELFLYPKRLKATLRY